MQGLMQDRPLVLTHFFDRAERLFPEKGVVTFTGRGVERVTYGDWAQRTRRLATVFDQLGVSADGRVATFAWNTSRHLELYFAAPCSGRVLHTLNIRLFPEQLTYIVNHAEDEVIFADKSLLGLLLPLAHTFSTVKHIVVMDDGIGEIPADTGGFELLDYEELLAAAEPGEFHVTDENQAASMCYTSGTTGHPKGVVYSHRSSWLHAFASTGADMLACSERDRILPVVPMFHVNAWGLPHACVATGADLIMPGPDLSPPGILRLIEGEKVTVAAGVPTIWMGLLNAIDGQDLSSLRAVVCGGSAVPRALSEGFKEKIGIPITQGWGMTETSPLGSVTVLKSSLDELDEDAKADLRASIGLPALGVELRIVDQMTGDPVPWDGVARGELQAAGPWIASSYYNDDRTAESFTSDGWLKTGDVATVDANGYMRIVDRTKDVVKSGGEWISSVELENEIMAHPKVAEAAVIGVKHPKWSERPLACVVVRPGEELTRDELIEFLEPRVAKWWLPDDVVFIDEVPKTSVGKFSKKHLRERFADHQLPTA
jgi:fatty-acyl-CoA synthase